MYGRDITFNIGDAVITMFVLGVPSNTDEELAEKARIYLRKQLCN